MPPHVAPLLDRVPAPLAAGVRWGLRHSNVVMFVAGFLFDVLTLQRIDARTDLAIQLAYIVCLTALIVLQHREAAGLWRPSRRFLCGRPRPRMCCAASVSPRS